MVRCVKRQHHQVQLNKLKGDKMTVTELAASKTVISITNNSKMKTSFVNCFLNVPLWCTRSRSWCCSSACRPCRRWGSRPSEGRTYTWVSGSRLPLLLADWRWGLLGRHQTPPTGELTDSGLAAWLLTDDGAEKERYLYQVSASHCTALAPSQPGHCRVILLSLTTGLSVSIKMTRRF